ncbi:MAG TPA: phage virion morphogenesis protein [Chitinispirillaceae bacterium]|nr:phage virion morphogenesis protein [Chitinispirillaceae bacterium]
MPTPKVKIAYGPVTRRLHIIKRNGGNLQKPLAEIGEIILSSIEENFLQEGRYESADSWHGGTNRWVDLAESTKKARRKKGKWPGKKLQMSQGGLAASITANVSGDNLEIGTNKVYGAIQQLGGKAGRNHSVTVPARPYLVVQNEDLDDAMDVLGRHIMKE